MITKRHTVNVYSGNGRCDVEWRGDLLGSEVGEAADLPWEKRG